jgi:transposase
MAVQGATEAGLPAICIETRHTKAVLKAQVNKSDRNDARGIAQMMRVNLFRPVHVKTLASQKRRALLTARKLLQEKAIAIENDIRGLLRNFGLKVGAAGVIKFEDRVRELVEGMPDLAEIMASLLDARQKLREQVRKLRRKLVGFQETPDRADRCAHPPLLTQPVFLIVDSVPLAQSRESGDAPAHEGYAQTDLVGGHRALQVTSLS